VAQGNSSPTLQSLDFDPAAPRIALDALPAVPAVFALYGASEREEPYIGRTPNLRGRLARLLLPSAAHPRRLYLAGQVRRIAWRPTGSEFESLLLQFALLEKVYSAKCLERMHLRAPAFVRFFGSNEYPRVAVTNRPGLREAALAYGPFPSRAAAERFAEEALKLFLLRRCSDDLAPDPGHPGCVYSEMKMCLAPCYKGCTDERYAEEAAAVQKFLATRGESRLVVLSAARDRASENLEFEKAAALHAQVERVEAVRSLAAELVRPLSQLRAVILQASANPGEAAVFLYENGLLRGPVMQGAREQGSEGAEGGRQAVSSQLSAFSPDAPHEDTRDQGNEKQGLGTRDVGTEEQGAREQGSEGAEGGGEAVSSQLSAFSSDAQNESATEGTQSGFPPRRGEENLAQGGSPGLAAQADSQAPEGRQNPATPVAHEVSGLGLTGRGKTLPEKQQVSGCDFSRADARHQSRGALAPAKNTAPAKTQRGLLEARLEAVLAELSAPAAAPSATVRQAHLALVKRWYYRPEARRAGEIFFPNADGAWPVKAILRGVGRVAAEKLKSAIPQAM
jgi:hypothetical protein